MESPARGRSTRRAARGGEASPQRAASPKPTKASRGTARSPSPTTSSRKKSAASPSPAPKRTPRATAVSKPKASSAHGPHYEFGGPIVALGILIGLPAVCYGLVFICNSAGCFSLTEMKLPPAPRAALASLYGLLAYLAWFGLCLALHVVLPGKLAQGTVLADGSRLTYKLNGLAVHVALYAIAAAGWWLGFLDASLVHKHFLEFLTGGIVFCYGLSLYLYRNSFRKGKHLLAKGGDTGNRLYDFFIGRELNPRLGDFDWKEWCELTPGLSLWLLLDLAFAAAQFQQDGKIYPAMALVCLGQAVYVFDAVANEPAILTTMDITTDGFGFMLVFGDLVWVPFTYSLQARYILEHPASLSWVRLAAMLVLQVGGYAVFRGANGQKDQFRRNPNAPEVAHIKYIDTARGTKLMVSGWWGLARHINYTGDWMMGWAWCLSCGYGSIVPYFYVIYFGVLLIHREMRDEESCRAKYGKDWDRYCSIVKYRFFPGIY